MAWQQITCSEEIEEFRSDGQYWSLYHGGAEDWGGTDLTIRAYYERHVLVAIIYIGDIHPLMRERYWFKSNLTDMITDLLASFSLEGLR